MIDINGKNKFQHPGKGKEIAIRTSVSDWKKRARRIIEAKYTDQEKLLARATKERVIAIQKFYAPIVDSYKYDWEDYLAKITKKNNEAKKEHGLNIALESFLSPNRAYSPASIEKEILRIAARDVNYKFRKARDKIRQTKRTCLTKIKNGAIPKVKLLSSASYQNQIILPGKELLALLPIDTQESTLPDTVNVRIYDLVTKTDAAGNPVKRTHFTFKLTKK